MWDMANDGVSVRLGDLTEAVDEEARIQRRTRSQTIRILLEDALRLRAEGQVKFSDPAAVFVERFTCATPPLDASYQVLRSEWQEREGQPMLRLIHEIRLAEPARPKLGDREQR